MKISNVYIKDFKEGVNVKGFYLCKYVEKKTTRLGDEYLDLMLEDKTGHIRAKIWSFVNTFHGLINEGEAVSVKGDIILFNKEKEINISHINNINESIYKKYGYKRSMLIRTIDNSISSLTKYLNHKIKKINKGYIGQINSLVNDNIEKLKKVPSNHLGYNISGGLLLEITDVLKLNDLLIEKYKDFNQSIIISGIIVKKIGLIEYYNDDLQFSIKKNKEDIDASLLSVNIVNKYFREKSFEPIKLILQSIIMNHSNKKSKCSNYINALYQLNGLCKHT